MRFCHLSNGILINGMMSAGLEVALADHVGEFPANGHVVAGQLVVAHNNPGTFPQTHFRAHTGQIGVLKAGDVLAEELQRDLVLTAALGLALGQIPRIICQNIGHLRGMLHVRLNMAALSGRDEEANTAVLMPFAGLRPILWKSMKPIISPISSGLRQVE